MVAMPIMKTQDAYCCINYGHSALTEQGDLQWYKSGWKYHLSGTKEQYNGGNTFFFLLVFYSVLISSYQYLK